METNNNKIKNIIVSECLDVLKRNDVKNHLKDLLKPLINTILTDIYPYIFLSILFVLISFLLRKLKFLHDLLIQDHCCRK